MNWKKFASVITNLMTGLQQNMTQNFSDLQQSINSWCDPGDDYFDYEDYDYENIEDTYCINC